MNRNKVVNLIKKHEDIANLGSADDAPASEWINKAEHALGVTLPDNYKWFLSEFGGGEICGEEIYSIYGVPFDEAVGGDLVYQNTIANNNVILGRIVLSSTDFGEDFYFKINDFDKVYIAIDNREELYAEDFIEYLYKRLISYI
ncbi:MULTISPECIES: SMI1/KNR4 family protein [unclassified Brenneria]|uniref:SMI1/KNR4 family protein n=1 Tax=unclassified Brenneria TaxID=2634434 RepID=UPI0029C1E0C9|nr:MULTISPECIES: SMI1/KNR4 family protein [unclassified Brenneria]MDX5630841.1 SMI1/KNR4 family protein [Brenneria sp. L3-3Z]MDX5697923.1 SMI1/KNR4 family protein [Brenneria sp. L4-2C]